MSKFLITICSLSLFSLFGAEVDEFYTPAKMLSDALPKINKQSNFYLAESVKEANVEATCSEELLYEKLRMRFHNHWKGELVPWINGLEEVEGQKIEDTIYKDYKWNQSLVLGLVYRVNNKPMGYIVNLGGEYYGTDKFEHFFSKGFSYFIKYYKEKKELDDALAYGVASENSYLGALMTGVFSYGDLAANFNGMRFWNHILQKNDDVLGSKNNSGPYVKCLNGAWKVVKKIDWGLYFDQSFSEAHNCSKFRSEKLYLKATNQIKKLSEQIGKDISCPSQDVDKEALYKKYGPTISDSILNLEGHDFLRN